MFGVYIDRVRKSLSAVSAHLETSDSIRTMIARQNAGDTSAPAGLDLTWIANPPDATEWKVIDHAAALSRTYAIYEQFVHELMREYVTFLETSVGFGDLDPKFSAAYRHGISLIAQKIEFARFSHLSLKTVISDYAGALSGNQPYSLVSEALLVHERNLNMQELSQLFAPCGLEGIEQFLSDHPQMQEFFQAGGRLEPNATAELKRLIQDRNESAHGGMSLSQILGKDELVEYSEFCALLCECLAERVQKGVLEKSLGLTKARTISKSPEVLKQGAVVIDKIEGSIQSGMTVYIVGGGRCFEAKISSVQIDGEEIDGVTAIQPLELGLGLSCKVKKGYKLVAFGGV
jgi:hypothetical protein